jgi:uncharacterized protein
MNGTTTGTPEPAGCSIGWALIIVILSPLWASAQQEGLIALERPGDRDFVLDKAGLLPEGMTQEIRQIADQLLSDKAVPIVVVTIDSMAAHGGANLRIETFARLLFDQWGIGYDRIGETSWNHGILLLISKDDRQARIELGADWGREKDSLCRQIMDEQIIPQFRGGNYPAGILAGVQALDKMARGLAIPQAPSPPKPDWYYPLMAVLFGLAVFTAVSLYRRGSSGWAWLFWGAVFTVLFVVLHHMATSSRSSGGGGFGGGSFGGGFSGGGGASGSW